MSYSSNQCINTQFYSPKSSKAFNRTLTNFNPQINSPTTKLSQLWKNKSSVELIIPQSPPTQHKIQYFLKNYKDNHQKQQNMSIHEKYFLHSHYNEQQDNSFLQNNHQNTIKMQQNKLKKQILSLKTIKKSQNQIILLLQNSNKSLLSQLSEIKQKLEKLAEIAFKREEELLSTISHYQQLIEQKQEIIKKMSKFNDQLCKGFLEKAFKNMGYNLQQSQHLIRQSQKQIQSAFGIQKSKLKPQQPQNIINKSKKSGNDQHKLKVPQIKRQNSCYHNISSIHIDLDSIDLYQTKGLKKNFQKQSITIPKEIANKNQSPKKEQVEKLKNWRILPISFEQSLPLEQDHIDENMQFNLSGQNIINHQQKKVEQFQVCDLSKIDIKCSFPSFQSFEPSKQTDLIELSSRKKPSNDQNRKNVLKKKSNEGTLSQGKSQQNSVEKHKAMIIVEEESLGNSNGHESSQSQHQKKNVYPIFKSKLNSSDKNVYQIKINSQNNKNHEKIQYLLSKCYQTYGDQERIKLIESCEKIQKRQSLFANPPKSLTDVKGIRMVSTIRNSDKSNENIKNSDRISQVEKIQESGKQYQRAKINRYLMKFKQAQSIEESIIVSKKQLKMSQLKNKQQNQVIQSSGSSDLAKFGGYQNQNLFEKQKKKQFLNQQALIRNFTFIEKSLDNRALKYSQKGKDFQQTKQRPQTKISSQHKIQIKKNF